MGLLEKAGNIQKEEEKPETKVVPKPVEKVPPKAETKPKEKAKKVKKERPKKEKKPKAPRAPRVKKEIPDGFEAATKGQKFIRRSADFLVSYGWMIPLLAITAWGSNFNPTIFMFLGIGLMAFNLWFMPSYAGQRTVGNWVSRTRYVNTRGDSPFWAYLLVKGLTFPLVIIGIITIFTITSELPSSTGGQVFAAIGVLLIFPPLIDYIMYRLRGDLGLWDTAFGGVWLVRTTKSKQTKGWLKRLENISDWTESKGLLDDEDKLETDKQ
tara:strand:- start:11824 stop:12627 length:804 start_codon:yes stop_codon:yes gene_type:complete